MVASGEEEKIMSKITHYRELLVWQKGIDLADGIYAITSAFPKEELYGLAAQMRRAAVSIPSNIAEGCARNSTKEFIRFIYISKGSLAELETQVFIAEKRKYISGDKVRAILASSEEISRMLSGLLRALNEKQYA